jgi:hypothetical protein
MDDRLLQRRHLAQRQANQELEQQAMNSDEALHIPLDLCVMPD